MGLFKMFKEDVDVVFDQDPAARSYIEVILTYSGLHAIWGHRWPMRFTRGNSFFLPV